MFFSKHYSRIANKLIKTIPVIMCALVGYLLDKVSQPLQNEMMSGDSKLHAIIQHRAVLPVIAMLAVTFLYFNYFPKRLLGGR